MKNWELMQPAVITPEFWVLLDVTHTFQVILSGSVGGYMISDDWRISTEIEQRNEFDDRFEFVTRSGSNYVCYKSRERMTILMASILEGFRKNGNKVEIVHSGDTPTSS